MRSSLLVALILFAGCRTASSHSGLKDDQDSAESANTGAVKGACTLSCGNQTAACADNVPLTACNRDAIGAYFDDVPTCTFTTRFNANSTCVAVNGTDLGSIPLFSCSAQDSLNTKVYVLYDKGATYQLQLSQGGRTLDQISLEKSYSVLGTKLTGGYEFSYTGGKGNVHILVAGHASTLAVAVHQAMDANISSLVCTNLHAGTRQQGDLPESAASSSSRPSALMKSLCNLADAEDHLQWLASPPDFDSPALASTLMPCGKYPGASLAVIPKAGIAPQVWVGRHDGESDKDVAHVIAKTIPAGDAGPLSDYAERVPLGSVDADAPSSITDHLPSFVRKVHDTTIYVRWETNSDTGEAALFKVVAI